MPRRRKPLGEAPVPALGAAATYNHGIELHEVPVGSEDRSEVAKCAAPAGVVNDTQQNAHRGDEIEHAPDGESGFPHVGLQERRLGMAHPQSLDGDLSQIHANDLTRAELRPEADPDAAARPNVEDSRRNTIEEPVAVQNSSGLAGEGSMQGLIERFRQRGIGDPCVVISLAEQLGPILDGS